MQHRFTIVGLGEALFDLLPEGDRLGGAPLNVAVNAHRLAQARGGRGVVVSRVGQDALGQDVEAQLQSLDMTLDYLQTDPDRPTGTVDVDLSTGSPQYTITENVAWDVLQYDPDLEDLAQHCEAVAFGSLAQRDAQSRNTIYRFLDTARRAFKLFDVNLRPPFVDTSHIKRSCELANAVKLNEEELEQVAPMLGAYDRQMNENIAQIIREYDLSMLVLTRGENGTAIYTPDQKFEGDPASVEALTNQKADPVGAGDSVTAAILTAKCSRFDLQKAATLANRVGAAVASRSGGTPELPDDLLQAFA